VSWGSAPRSRTVGLRRTPYALGVIASNDVDNGHVVLVGGMGVGKSTVGRLVATRLGWAFRDSDEALAARGDTGRALAEREGVGALHRFERSQLLEALADPTPSVVAAAASVVDDPTMPDTLAPAFVVWLRADATTVARRIASSTYRRDVGPDPVHALDHLVSQRQSAYARAADLVIDVDDQSPDDVATTVLTAFRAQPAR
jgi:shikimate kinase